MQSIPSHAESVRAHEQQDEHEPSPRPPHGLAKPTPSSSRVEQEITCTCRRFWRPCSRNLKPQRRENCPFWRGPLVASRLCGAWIVRSSGTSTTCCRQRRCRDASAVGPRAEGLSSHHAAAQLSPGSETLFYALSRTYDSGRTNSCMRSCRRRLRRPRQTTQANIERGAGMALGS